MLGLEHHAQPLELQLLLQPAGDLDVQSLLELEVAGGASDRSAIDGAARAMSGLKAGVGHLAVRIGYHRD